MTDLDMPEPMPEPIRAKVLAIDASIADRRANISHSRLVIEREEQEVANLLAIRSAYIDAARLMGAFLPRAQPEVAPEEPAPAAEAPTKRVPANKLDIKKVKAIRQDWMEGKLTASQIMAKHGISKASVYNYRPHELRG